MKKNTALLWLVISIFILSLLPACSGPSRGGIPDIEKGRFNIAMVLIGPHDDEGWSQAHYEGLQYVSQRMSDVNTVYLENIPDNQSSEAVFNGLAKKGFDLIIGTSYGYQDPMEVVAADYPDIMFISITGEKSNGMNFGNLMGAMEDMKYLSGLLAGARAEMDGNRQVGYMATFPIPEEFRLGNAFALGVTKTCPRCKMDVEWINSWHDPQKEKAAAVALFDRGAQVVMTGADTPAVSDAAEDVSRWAITYDWSGSCTSDRCLTAPYWIWGPVYLDLAESVRNGTYRPGWDYFEASSGGLGLYGFMAGENLQPGVSDLPEEVISEVRYTLDRMVRGELNRFDVFAGPLIDQNGQTVLPEGERLQQLDLVQFPESNLGCTVCMKWWAQGVIADIP